MGNERSSQDTIEKFIAGVDEKEVQLEVWKQLNDMFSQLSYLVHYKHHLLMYKLVKKKVIKPDDLAEAAGYTKSRLYKIIADFEEKERERMASQKLRKHD